MQKLRRTDSTQKGEGLGSIAAVEQTQLEIDLVGKEVETDVETKMKSQDSNSNTSSDHAPPSSCPTAQTVTSKAPEQPSVASIPPSTCVVVVPSGAQAEIKTKKNSNGNKQSKDNESSEPTTLPTPSIRKTTYRDAPPHDDGGAHNSAEMRGSWIAHDHRKVSPYPNDPDILTYLFVIRNSACLAPV
ncbi:hypothetical protein BT96DRAFT_918836 [Gymnopus androsaceus JB14]|uniref:Uncharacterized protein n=1 Tax=Gymnopus androsaceus JB14 TaxID=1447944 RepID=A0A6A4HX84_9AGAR|nr:hypothetical protein BT96DRAFT_918836 [Gymnopus androsaceus JB14]